MKEFYPDKFPVRVDAIEVENGPSLPTVHLMDHLQKKFSEKHKFHFLMGSDLIATIHEWEDYERMIKEIPAVLFQRKGVENKQLESHTNYPKHVKVVTEGKSLIGVISSTEVRRRVN